MPSRPIGLLLAALALPGLASPARALEASPSDILAAPDQFDGRPVALRGTIADLQELGATTYTFTLGDGTRTIRVLAQGTPSCGAGEAATVEGVFRKEKRDGYTIYSEVEATRVTCR
jgi:hypothetical protein